MNRVDKYESLVQTYDLDFETHCRAFARGLAAGIEENQKLDFSQKNIYSIPLNVFSSSDIAGKVARLAGAQAALPPFHQWLNPNLKMEERSEEEVRYFQRRMGIVGRLVEKILNESFAAKVSSDSSLRGRAVYIDDVQQMSELHALIEEVDSTLGELSMDPTDEDQDHSLCIEIGCGETTIQSHDEDDDVPLPKAEGGESQFILDLRKGETSQKIERVKSYLTKKNIACFSVGSLVLLSAMCVVFATLAEFVHSRNY